MALVPWEDIKAQVGYDGLTDEDKIDNINKYSSYVQEYYTNVEPQDPKLVGQASDEFVNLAARDVLGNLGPVERASAFLGNIYKGASGTFTSAFRAAALTQQVIGEQLGAYDDDSPIAERDLYKLANNIDESVKETTGIEDPRLRGEFINTLLPQGLGSALGFLGAGAVAAAAAPASAAGAVGLGAAATLGAASTAGSQYEEARQFGANEFVARSAAAMGGVIGTTEAIPLGRLASRLTAGIAKRSILAGIAEGGLEEFAQESFSQGAQNLVASRLAGYDPDRPIGQGVLQSGAVGLVTGGLIGGGVNAITRDNMAFYGESMANDISGRTIDALRISQERTQQIQAMANNAGTTTVTETDPATGEQAEVQRDINIFGTTDPVPEIGSDPQRDSVYIGTLQSQEDGRTTEAIRYRTPSGNVWQAEYVEGQPVRVTDATQQVQREEREAQLETDAKLLRDAQREILTGQTNQQAEPTSEIPSVPERDERGVARQGQLNREINRLYELRDQVIASGALVGQQVEPGQVGQYDPNLAVETTQYGGQTQEQAVKMAGNPSLKAVEDAIRKGEVDRRKVVSVINKMLAKRENELRGLVARPESYILASERNAPPTQSEKDSLVLGFNQLFSRITSPALRAEVSFEVGDIQPLIDSGRLPKGAVAYFERASNGRKAILFLSDKLATMPNARREILHELGHGFWDTLPTPIQAQLRELWSAETGGRAGPLYDENGGLLSEVSPRVATDAQEWFSERLSWSNDNWAKGRSEGGIMGRTANGFRTLLDKFLRYTGHGDRINLEFKAYLDQGDRFSRLREATAQAVSTAGGTGAEAPDELSASVRGLTGDENTGPRRERIGTTGQYVGLPEGIDAPRKYRDLMDRLEGLAKEGEAGRFWYERSSEEILRIVGGNVNDAEILVAFIAAYSPQNRVYPNWGQAIRAYAEYKRGDRITQGKTAEDVARGQRIADGDRWSGIKTNNFYHNLMVRIDPARTTQGATIDLWIMRVFGYKTVSPSPTQYGAAEKVIKELATRLGWEPQQVQAAIWVAGKAKWEDVIWPETRQRAIEKGDMIQIDKNGKKKWDFRTKEIGDKYRKQAMRRIFEELNVDVSDAAMDFSDMARRNLATMSVETRFGRTVQQRWQDKLNINELLQYHQQIEQVLTDSNGFPIILRETGVPMDQLYQAVGLWGTETNPLTQVDVPSYRDTRTKGFKTDPRIAANMNDALAMMGILLKQDGMAWHQPFFTDDAGGPNIKDANGVQFNLGRRTTESETLALGQAFGDGYAVVNVADGFRVLKFTDSVPNQQFHKNAESIVSQLIEDDVDIRMKRFSFDGNLLENNWTENPNGENYRRRIGESGRSDLFRGIEDLLGPQIERVNSYWRNIAESRGSEEGQPVGGQRGQPEQGTQGQGIQEEGSPEVRPSVRGDIEPRNVQAAVRENFQQRIAEPVLAFGRRNLRTGGALPYEMFRSIEQQGFNVNEKMLRAQNAVDDLEAAVKKVTGKNLSNLTEAQIKRLNDALQNPSQRASLNPEIAVALGNMRNLLDALSAELMRSGAIGENLLPTITANLGVYLHRSYEKWENPNYENPFNRLDPKVQNRLKTIVRESLEKKYANNYAKEQSLARGESAISPESAQYKADYEAGLQAARNGGVSAGEIKGMIDYLAQPEGDSPFSQLGSVLTKDLSILMARKEIPEEIRLLWGEIRDPRVNFLKSVAKMAGLLETHNMLKQLRDAGMNRIFFTTPRDGFSTRIVSDGSRTASPLNMFVEGMRNEVYTSPEIADALRDAFSRRGKPEDFMGRLTDLYLRLNGFSKFAKTVLSVQTQVRNVLGNAMFLVANGYIFSPDGRIALEKLRTLALPVAAGQLRLTRNQEIRDYNARLTRLGILGQSVFAQELQEYFKDAQVNVAQDMFDNYLVKAIKAVGRGAVRGYQLGDAIPKVIAFEVELARLRRAYPTQPLSKLERDAADVVLNSLPTYSRIPRLGNFLRQQPFVGAFISFPLEVVRTGYNLLSTINSELRSSNPEVRRSGAYRLVGTMMASVGFSAVASALAYAMGIDDEEDQAIRKLDAPWDKYSTKLYLGRDARGNVNQVNLSYVDPYNYFRDPIIALAKADGSWENRFLEAVKNGFQPFFGEQILASKVLDIARNKKGTTGGRVYNPEAPADQKAAAIAGHMFDAFNLGTIASADRIYKGLTGQVTPTGRAYDPALETLATVTGQRVITLDPRQSLSFAARRFNNRLNEATGLFTAAYYDRSNVNQDARLQAYKDMERARASIFGETSDIINAAMKLGVTRGEVVRILREQGISADNARALAAGIVTAYRPRKELRGEVSRYRQQAAAGQ